MAKPNVKLLQHSNLLSFQKRSKLNWIKVKPTKSLSVHTKSWPKSISEFLTGSEEREREKKTEKLEQPNVTKRFSGTNFGLLMIRLHNLATHCGEYFKLKSPNKSVICSYVQLVAFDCVDVHLIRLMHY